MVLWLCTTPSGNCSKDKWFLFVFASFFELSVAVEIEHIANSLRKNGVSLKHCLISKKKNNKLTFYDLFSMESNESVMPFPNDSWFFSCMYETYESFFGVLTKSIRIGFILRMKSNLSSFHHWTQVSNHWFGKCTSIDKKWLQKKHIFSTWKCRTEKKSFR